MKTSPEPRAAGKDLYDLCQSLYPLCRSITGNGVRQTLAALQSFIPLKVREVPSGRRAFDWDVPLEWNLNEAFIETAAGERIVDTADHNLHIVSYSVPTDQTCTREELETHLHSLPDRPDWIPYRTSYYAPSWGFCLTDSQRRQLPPGPFRVKIDATLENGSLSYGELHIPGSTGRDILISTHVCHPSLANDNLSGIAVATHLARHFADRPLRYGLRFIFVPATIGAIVWLSENESIAADIRDGLVISGVGDRGRFTYKKSRRGDGAFDRIFPSLFENTEDRVRPFFPYGYDERQYCSPGFDIAAGCLMRTPYGEYPEYHTSADNLDLICAESLQESLALCIRAIEEAQRPTRFVNLNPKCEPQLGKRGLYAPIGGENESKQVQLAQLWMLSYSDGRHSLYDIHDLSGIDAATLAVAAQRLESAGLLRAED